MLEIKWRSKFVVLSVFPPELKNKYTERLVEGGKPA